LSVFAGWGALRSTDIRTSLPVTRWPARDERPGE
jgi:hypothetical protein